MRRVTVSKSQAENRRYGPWRSTTPAPVRTARRVLSSIGAAWRQNWATFGPETPVKPSDLSIPCAEPQQRQEHPRLRLRHPSRLACLVRRRSKSGGLVPWPTGQYSACRGFCRPRTRRRDRNERLSLRFVVARRGCHGDPNQPERQRFRARARSPLPRPSCRRPGHRLKRRPCQLEARARNRARHSR